MDERRVTSLACLIFTLTSLAFAAPFRDPDVDYHQDQLRKGGGKHHTRVTPGSYLVVRGIESFNDVLWYMPTEPFTLAPSTTTTTTSRPSPAAAKPLRDNFLFQQQHHRGRGSVEPPPGSYEFGYGVVDSGTSSNFGHEESRRQDNAQGQYRVLLPDGRLQIVDYQADRRGFRPSVRYKDPTNRGNSLKSFRTY